MPPPTFINAIYISITNIVDITRVETQDRVSFIEIKSFKYILAATRIYEKSEIKIR